MRASIAVLAGDGIGPEVLSAAQTVLDAVCAASGHEIVCEPALIGGAAIDETRGPLPPETLQLSGRSDAVLLGAVGGPRWDTLPASIRPEHGLLALRKGLGLYANIRPVVPHPRGAAMSPLKADLLRGVDLVVVRELTGGIYFGDKERRDTPQGAVARDVCSYSSVEIERVTRVACAIARARRKRLTSVDKANVLETSRLWREVVTGVVRSEYPDVELEHMLVDACAMHLITRPTTFDVIVTENMFGDILTDEASVLAGSIGVLPSASFGDAMNTHGGRFGLYEPIHGSAPSLAGANQANPVGAILSLAMLLRWSLRLEAEARAIERAVERTMSRGIVTADLAPAGAAVSGTRDVAQAVAAALGTFLLMHRDQSVRRGNYKETKEKTQ